MQSDKAVNTDKYLMKFHEYIKRWYADFRTALETILSGGRKVYVVAISRKMPRFVKWMLAHNDILQLTGLESLLDSTIFTTEHALPFLFDEEMDMDSFEVMVIDDSIVTGYTMSRIVKEAALYSGKHPIISAIVTVKDAFTEIEISDTRLLPNIVSREDADMWLRFVAESNYESELPIDMVFPIFHLNGAGLKVYQDMCKKKLEPSKYYELGKDENHKSVNILLDEALSDNTLLDFSKGRIFFGPNSVKLAVFSPSAISSEDLENDSLFADNENLNRVWQTTCNRVHHRMETRSRSSLVVMINYLYAIIAFLRNKQYLIPNEDIDYQLNEKDLALLVGDDLAEMIFPDLCSSLHDRDKGRTVFQLVRFPSILAPEELRNAYFIERTLIAARHAREKDMEAVIEDLFDQARYDKSILGQNTSVYHRMYSTFSETYESIEYLLQLHFDGNAIQKTVNRKIDQLIDIGKVIPVYECVDGNDGFTYWRRYFRSAYSSVEL